MFTLDKETYLKEKNFIIEEQYIETKKHFRKPDYTFKLQRDFIEPQIPYSTPQSHGQTEPNRTIWIVLGILALIALMAALAYQILREDGTIVRQ